MTASDYRARAREILSGKPPFLTLMRPQILGNGLIFCKNK